MCPQANFISFKSGEEKGPLLGNGNAKRMGHRQWETWGIPTGCHQHGNLKNRIYFAKELCPFVIQSSIFVARTLIPIISFLSPPSLLLLRGVGIMSRSGRP
jgi:hypothetical protein